MLPLLTQEEVLRYTRHLIMPEVGMEGQQKLKAASVLLVGTGGLGSPIGLYLAAAGVGHIGVVDYDEVETSNLQRQVIHDTERLGMPKAESARQRMLAINPYIQVDSFIDIFTSENAEEITRGYDIVVDGTDNFPTRYLINDLCVLKGKKYVYGSVFRFEGQVSVFDAKQGPCYRCLFPEPPTSGLMLTPSEGGVFGILPGTIGTIQATEVIKLIIGAGNPLIGKLLLYDALEMDFQVVHLHKSPKCPVCGTDPSITELFDYEEYYGLSATPQALPTQVTVWDMDPQELAERLKSGDSIRLIDLRVPVEQQISSIPGSVSIPIEQVEQRFGEFSRDDEIVLFCRTGKRSMRALPYFLRAGFTRVKHLRGGINAWVSQVDQKMLLY